LPGYDGFGREHIVGWCVGSSGISVRPSAIAGGGLGLFTARDFAKGEVITWYDGAIISGAEAKAYREVDVDRVSHIRTLETGHTAIDGLKTVVAGRGGGSFANDANWEGGGHARKDQNNARWHRLEASTRNGLPGPTVVIVAKSDLVAGTEVTLPYGRQYWKDAMAAMPAVPARSASPVCAEAGDEAEDPC
jgi:hypothetical protein